MSQVYALFGGPSGDSARPTHPRPYPHGYFAAMNAPRSTLGEEDYTRPPPADVGWDTPDQRPPEAPRPRSCW